jgi:hypothetical protein
LCTRVVIVVIENVKMLLAGQIADKWALITTKISLGYQNYILVLFYLILFFLMYFECLDTYCEHPCAAENNTSTYSTVCFLVGFNVRVDTAVGSRNKVWLFFNSSSSVYCLHRRNWYLYKYES